WRPAHDRAGHVALVPGGAGGSGRERVLVAQPRRGGCLARPARRPDAAGLTHERRTHAAAPGGSASPSSSLATPTSATGIGAAAAAASGRLAVRAPEDRVLPRLVGQVDLLEPELLPLVDEGGSRQREQQQRRRARLALAEAGDEPRHVVVLEDPRHDRQRRER